MSKMTRVQFEISEDRLKELDELMSLADINNRKELFNNALTLFEWAVNQVSNNLTVCSFDNRQNKLRELSMPILDYIAKRSKQRLQESFDKTGMY